MSKKKKSKKINLKQVPKDFDEQHSDKNMTLIYGGVILAISSIGLLIFVISQKIFYLS
tara:strand:- start:233 stop:406 length:174 start_codon:yes stop_codon:yes gene_type:complete